jgi:hypothetical protein
MVLACMLVSSGCDGILDVEPVSDITNANYWKTEGDVSGYLTGVYTAFRDAINTTLYTEDRADVFVAGLEGGTSNAWAQNLNEATAPNWLDFYNLIHHCNLLLKYGKDIPFSNQKDKDRTMAETYFLRAYTYFILLRAWGKVPVVLEPMESSSSLLPARAPEAEVMQQILADVNMAISLFPEAGFVNKSRASKPTALMLKADVLLWQVKVLKQGGNEALQDALSGLQELETLAGLSMITATSFSTIFATNNRNNSEVIFSLHLDKDEYTDGQYARQLKPRDIFVQSATNAGSIAAARNGARSQYAPGPKLQAMYSPADKRAQYSYIVAVGAGGNVIGVFDNKYRGTRESGEWYYDSDIIVYRLAELYLFEAEILAALGRTGEAIATMNKTRNRAGIGDYTGAVDQPSLEKEILDERCREFWLELKRWPDLVRFHSAGTINIYEEVPNLQGKSGFSLYFPILSTQIALNPNLQQTDGY